MLAGMQGLCNCWQKCTGCGRLAELQRLRQAGRNVGDVAGWQKCRGCDILADMHELWQAIKSVMAIMGLKK